MHRADHARAREQRAENRQHEGDEDQPDVPHLHHAALFLHHHGVQESGAGNPRQQRGVFDRIPRPVAAPAEHRVSPVRAEQDANALEAPRHHGPAAGDVNPLLTGVAPEQRGQPKSERNRESGVAEIEHRRMNHHLGILQQRIQAVAFGEPRQVKHAGRIGASQYRKGRGHEIVQDQEEGLHAGENHAHVGHQFRVLLAVQK